MDQITPYLPGIALAYGAFLLSIMSPGPNILAIMGTSMAVSRKSGLALGVGVASGSLCWALLAVSGISAVLATYASALIVIKIAGGMYLLYLSYKAFRSAASAHDIEAAELAGGRRSARGYYWRGLTVSVTNPKAALAWIAIASLGMQQGAPVWVGVLIVAGTATLSLIIHSFYALAFSTPAMVRGYTKARRWIQGAFGAFFAFAGVKLMSDR